MISNYTKDSPMEKMAQIRQISGEIYQIARFL
jgi:hypothetical protein